MSEIICISGMHRSATSLTASWLEACGLVIHDGNCIGPGAGNLKGHFEDQDFVDLQRETISKQFPLSRGWIVVNGQKVACDKDFEKRARDLVADRSAKFPYWGWKDPRTTLFLPAWKQLIPHLKVILLWRRCREVTESLVDRARHDPGGEVGVGVMNAVACWCAYNRLVIGYKRRWQDECLLIPFDAVIAKDQLVMKLVESRFSLKLKYEPIGELYDPAMLKRRRPALLTRFFNRWYDVDALERQLTTASDMVA